MNIEKKHRNKNIISDVTNRTIEASSVPQLNIIRKYIENIE